MIVGQFLPSPLVRFGSGSLTREPLPGDGPFRPERRAPLAASRSKLMVPCFMTSTNWNMALDGGVPTCLRRFGVSWTKLAGRQRRHTLAAAKTGHGWSTKRPLR